MRIRLTSVLYTVGQVPSKELALQYAAQADADFTAGIYKSYIQGIPFAIKDTYDLAGHATAYGSWEYLDNIVDTESPLVTYALQAGAVPLFKSSVPQLTWGFANFNGTTYSCLNGGYSAGAGSSGGSSIGSGTAVCLGVVPVSICEQTGSSCQVCRAPPGLLHPLGAARRAGGADATVPCAQPRTLALLLPGARDRQRHLHDDPVARHLLAREQRALLDGVGPPRSALPRRHELCRLLQLQ